MTLATALYFKPTDPRLGRNIVHDDRSRMFAMQEDTSAIVSVRHQSAIGVLDQGNIGSCVPNAGTKRLTFEDIWDQEIAETISEDLTKVEQYAVALYSACETADGDGPYPPQDNGSTGLTVAKVLTQRGLISGYQHSFSFTAFLAGLAKAACIVGVTWYEDMFSPTKDGIVKPTGAVAGGHEFVADEIDTARELVGFTNSWSDTWGVKGRFYISFADFTSLLANNGDATFFVPKSQPAPQPAPVPVVSAKSQWLAFAPGWASQGHTGSNKQMATLTKAYIAAGV